MEKLTLIRPNLSFSDEIRAYRQEFLDLGSPLNGCGPLADMEDPAQWVVHTQRFELGEDIPEDMVPSTQFIYVRESDQKILGTIQIRHTFTPFLETYGGHIGYSIRPSERQKGYATKMLHDCLPYCRSLGLTVCWFAVWIPIPQAEKRSWQTAVSMTVLSMSRKARSTLSGIGLQ